jgi:hypothetical protein
VSLGKYVSNVKKSLTMTQCNTIPEDLDLLLDLHKIFP